MAAQPMPHLQRNINVENHTRAQSMHPHLAAAYPIHSSGLIVQPAYGQHATVHTNTTFLNNMEQHQLGNAVLSRRQSHHIGGTPSISSASQIDHKDNRDPHWSGNNHPRSENFNTGLPTPNRGSGQRNGPRNPKGNRRGSQGQRSVTGHVSQHQGNQGPGQNRRDGASWSSTWRRTSAGSQTTVCRNLKTANGGMQYVHCPCEECNNRNCSVYVTIKGSTANQPLLDVQARIKYGLGDRFGPVIDVFPLPSRDFSNFIARFAHEHSVSEALTFGGGDMPDREISVAVTPVLRSKWIVRSREGVIPADRHRSRDLSLQQLGYPFSHHGSPSAMNQQPPTAHLNSGSVAQLTHLAQSHPGFSNMQMPNAQLVHGGLQGQNCFPTGTQFAQPGYVRSGFPPQMPFAMQHHSFNPEKAQQQGQRNNSVNHEPSSGNRVILPKKPEAPTKETQKLTSSAAEAPRGPENTKPQDNDMTRGKIGKPNGAKPRVFLPKTTKPEATLKVLHKARPDHTQDATDDSKCDNHHPKVVENSSEKPALTPETTVVVPDSRRDERNSHVRVPSVFTDNEIKERRKAWARISMPLIPRKPKEVSTRVNEAVDTVSDTQQVSQEGKVGNSTTGSERSSPSHPCLTPDADSLRVFSLGKSFEAGATGDTGNKNLESLQNNSVSRRELSPRVEAAQQTAASSRQPSDEKGMKSALKPFKGPGGNQNKSKQVASGRESRQSDRSGHGSSSLSTPTISHPALPATRLSGSNPTSQTSNENSKIGELPRKNKNKNKYKKKPKQTEGSRSESPANNAATETQVHSKEESTRLSKKNTHGRQSSTNPILNEDSSGTMKTQVPQDRSISPSKRPREEIFQRFCSVTSKRNKQNGDQAQSPPPGQLSPLKPSEEAQATVVESSDRLAYRANAGGSLRMGKKRRNRALVTEPSVAEQRLDMQVVPPSSDFAFACTSVTPTAVNGFSGNADLGEIASPIAKSRLNPKAEDFHSPSRVTDSDAHEKAGDDTASNKGRSTTPHGPQKADNGSKTVSPKEQTIMEDKKGLAHDGETTTKSPTPAATTKKPSKSQKRDKVKDKAASTQGEAQEPHTPPKASPEKKKGLDNDDWPSLPPPRERAESKSSTRSLSLWTKKVGGSEQCSPARK
ncbi:hypothetical protein AK830_g6132 [Neonectria ditissima]|uniref:Uncharacterized protein n=1 Tax=Neonectria ditissima TaxID=78410 RepID=A0A0N8H709_9HYPO|nr:hypothetical protein AK830_g6132 [Neonectria ditissima]